MSAVVLGVGGGIAAYKAADLLRKLAEAGHDVTVVPTASALQFVGPATWAALSHRPVASDVWTDADQVPHVRLGRHADLVVVAPATADLLARAAHGLADDLLTNTLLTARCPVLFVPAMHTEMWEHPATVDNVATLRRRGAVVMEPATGRLTGTDTGKGRLPEPAEIAAVAELLLARPDALPQDLAGVHVVVSAGGARPGRRPAHQHAAHRAVPGAARPGDAHRDVGAPGHPGQRRHPALARGARARPGVGAAHRRRHRPGPAARTGGDLRRMP